MATKDKMSKDSETMQDTVTPTVDTKKKEVPSPAKTDYVSIDTFLETAITLYGLSRVQIAGFKGYMRGKFYQKKDKDFVPYLNKYLGKGDK